EAPRALEPVPRGVQAPTQTRREPLLHPLRLELLADPLHAGGEGLLHYHFHDLGHHCIGRHRRLLFEIRRLHGTGRLPVGCDFLAMKRRRLCVCDCTSGALDVKKYFSMLRRKILRTIEEFSERDFRKAIFSSLGPAPLIFCTRTSLGPAARQQETLCSPSRASKSPRPAVRRAPG